MKKKQNSLKKKRKITHNSKILEAKKSQVNIRPQYQYHPSPLSLLLRALFVSLALAIFFSLFFFFFSSSSSSPLISSLLPVTLSSIYPFMRYSVSFFFFMNLLLLPLVLRSFIVYCNTILWCIGLLFFISTCIFMNIFECSGER